MQGVCLKAGEGKGSVPFNKPIYKRIYLLIDLFGRRMGQLYSKRSFCWKAFAALKFFTRAKH